MAQGGMHLEDLCSTAQVAHDRFLPAPCLPFGGFVIGRVPFGATLRGGFTLAGEPCAGGRTFVGAVCFPGCISPPPVGLDFMCRSCASL